MTPEEIKALMSDTPRTDFVAHESGDPEWNRFPNRFARMMAHACILERENQELRSNAERIRVSTFEFINDWRKGDFDLPSLAEYDVWEIIKTYETIDSKVEA